MRSAKGGANEQGFIFETDELLGPAGGFVAIGGVEVVVDQVGGQDFGAEVRVGAQAKVLFPGGFVRLPAAGREKGWCLEGHGGPGIAGDGGCFERQAEGLRPVPHAVGVFLRRQAAGKFVGIERQLQGLGDSWWFQEYCPLFDSRLPVGGFQGQR